MSTRATGTFKIEGWDEQAYSESDDGAKLTRAAVKQAFSGDIEGEGAVEWLMCYRPDQTADFVGLQRIVGDFFERARFVQNERPGRLAHERAHVRRHAERGPQIVTERAHVGAFAAVDAQARDAALFYTQHRDRIDRGRARPPFDLFAGARQLV